MPEYPLVTVVTPSLNQGQYIRDAIESVLAQDYPNVELIVMDGGSTDGTQDILKSYGNRIVWQSKPDSGQSAAINDGFRLTAGMFYTWTAADDALLSGAISAAVETFREHPEAGIVFGDTVFVGPDSTPIFASTADDFDYQRFVQYCHNPIPQPSAFIRREAWEELDESLHYFLDWDLWQRIGAKWPIVHVPALWSMYRLHSESKTCKLAYPAHELEYIYRKNFGGAKIPPSVYSQMAEYYTANGQWWKAFLNRRKRWIANLST